MFAQEYWQKPPSALNETLAFVDQAQVFFRGKGYHQLLPDTDGWIFHTDWDGRFEGVWADRKTRQILAYPYVEKQFHGAVAITYRIPLDGTYAISGGVTDLQVAPQFPQHDGIVWHLDLTDDGTTPGKRLATGTPIGDGGGRPDAGPFAAGNVDAKKGQLIRLVLHPRKWWGSDLTRIDAFRIEPAKIDSLLPQK